MTKRFNNNIPHLSKKYVIYLNKYFVEMNLSVFLFQLGLKHKDLYKDHLPAYYINLVTKFPLRL